MHFYDFIWQLAQDMDYPQSWNIAPEVSLKSLSLLKPMPLGFRFPYPEENTGSIHFIHASHIC